MTAAELRRAIVIAFVIQTITIAEMVVLSAR
jgi:hypothetical protein